MKRELLVPLLLIVGVSMLVTPIKAQVVIPFDLQSDGYGKMRIDEKWGFWPIYCRGPADFSYSTDTEMMDTIVGLDIYGRRCYAYASWIWIYDVLFMEACGPIFTFELPAPDNTNGFEIGGARVVLFVMSGVPDPMDIPNPMDGLDDPDACGIVVVYGYFYMGRIDYINWNIAYVISQDG